jgi:hypothetical protein
MRLEWISPVGDEHHQASSRPQDAHDLLDRSPIVTNVLEDFVREGQVERAVGVRKAFRRSANDGGRRGAAAGGPGVLGVELDSMGLVRAQFKVRQVFSHATPIVEDPAARSAAGGVQDHLQAAFLTGAPYVRRLPT